MSDDIRLDVLRDAIASSKLDDKIRIGDPVISLNPETGRNEPDTVG